MPRRERQWQIHSLDTPVLSTLWRSHQMATTSSQALSIEQFVCGMPRQERQWQVHSLDTEVRSTLWHSPPMAITSSQARMIEQFEFQMLQNGKLKLKMMLTSLITP